MIFMRLMALVTLGSVHGMIFASSTSAVLLNPIEKNEICRVYQNTDGTLDFGKCLTGAFYDSDQTASESEISLTLSENLKLTICKFYLDRTAAKPTALIDGCQSFAAPRSCAQTIRNTVAIALAQKFPSVAQSFSIWSIRLKGDDNGIRRYKVATTDEVASQLWTVEARGTKQQCEAISVTATDGGVTGL